jgi:hypothetical protein
LNIFSKFLENFPNSLFHKEKTMLLMSKYILKCKYKFVIYTMNIFHNIISHVTKWNSNTNPMKKFIFHAIIIHKFTKFLISQNWKNKTPGFTSLQNNSLHICFETLASYSSISCQNKYSKRKKKKKKTFVANFYLVVVVVDILKPNHSPKTAANRQVRFKGLG